MTELDQLTNVPSCIHIGGTEISITPIKVRELQAFIRAAQPIAVDVATGDIMAALANHADNLIEAAAIGARVDRDFVLNLELDDLITLASKVVEVNADFFARRIAPAIQQASENLSGKLAGLSLMQEPAQPG